MPLRRREPNCGPPTLRMLQTAEGESETYKCRNKTTGRWKKSDLVNKHIKHFIQFANSIDFEKL
jgi:hypothetical protein